MAASVHPTAVVDAAARLGDGVTIGPLCVVGGEAVLDDGVALESHVVITGRTRVGAGTRIYPFAVIGTPPQDVGYKGESSGIVIGRGNVIREHVTINPGTARGQLETRIGDGCFLMVGAHIAHDCMVGDRVIMANNATLAGHVSIGHDAILGGLTAVHQFVRIGEHAFIGGMTGVERDVIPYGMVVSERGHLAGLNLVGLRRRGFDHNEIHRMRAAFRTLFHGDGEWESRIDQVAEAHGDVPAVRRLVEFIRADSRRKILQSRGEDGV